MTITTAEYNEWLEGENDRVLLAVLTAISGGVEVNRYVADRTFVTEPHETPANTVFDGRVLDGTQIERTMGSVFRSRGAQYNGGELVLANPDGALDSWRTDSWRGQPVALYFGDPSWSYADITSKGKIFDGVAQQIRVNDTQFIITLQGKQQKLQDPIQALTIWKDAKKGGLLPLAYGYPKNVPGVITEDQSSDMEVVVHEDGDIEDPAVARYDNQVTSTSPTITKNYQDDSHIDFNGNPGGMMTYDVKGAKPDDPTTGTWITKPGESIEEMLTRSVDFDQGITRDGSSTTLQLEESASDEDDFYNGYDFSIAVDEGASASFASGTCTDYDGVTRTVTVSSWTYSTGSATPGEGTGYKINDEGVDSSFPDNQLGPLTAAEVDSDAMDQLDTDLPYECGVYINDDGSAEQWLNRILGPGAGYWWTRAGKLSAKILVDPSSETADLSLSANEIAPEQGIEIEQGRPPVYQMRVGYDKNHTVQTVSGDGLSIDRQNWIDKEYRYTAKKSDSTIKDADPEARDVTVDTVFTTESDAFTELDRLWTLFSVQRYLYTVRALTKPLQVDIGDVMEVTDSRYGMDSGTNMVVIGMREYPLTGRTEITGWA